jgi:hypothetical protein
MPLSTRRLRRDDTGGRQRRVGPKAPRVSPDHKAPQVHREPKASKASRVRKVQWRVTCGANETLVSVFCPSGGAPDGAKCGTSPSVGLCLKKP